jgi:MFS family permease
MTALVLAALLANTYGWVIAKKDFAIGDVTLLPEGSISPVIILFGAGVLLLLAFAWICTRREHHGKEPLVPTRILFNLIVQAVQWFLQLGVLFVITVFVQQALGLNAIQSGVTMVPAIIGLMLLSRRASHLAEKYSLRWIMQVGFVVAEIGILLVMLLADDDGSAWRFVPGLFLLGAGMGLIMPASVTFVQSTSPEADQSAISGVSRAASNLGSSLGTAVAGSVLVVLVSGGASYERGLVFALLAVGVASLIGFVATFFIPGRRHSAATAS